MATPAAGAFFPPYNVHTAPAAARADKKDDFDVQGKRMTNHEMTDVMPWTYIPPLPFQPHPPTKNNTRHRAQCIVHVRHQPANGSMSIRCKYRSSNAALRTAASHRSSGSRALPLAAASAHASAAIRRAVSCVCVCSWVLVGV